MPQSLLVLTRCHFRRIPCTVVGCCPHTQPTVTSYGYQRQDETSLPWLPPQRWDREGEGMVLVAPHGPLSPARLHP